MSDANLKKTIYDFFCAWYKTNTLKMIARSATKVKCAHSVVTFTGSIPDLLVWKIFFTKISIIAEPGILGLANKGRNRKNELLFET